VPHSDHIDRWQRETEGLTPDPATPAEYLLRMRGMLDRAEARAKVEAEGRAIRASNARESAYWRRVHGCPDCGIVGGHHPSCGYGPERADTMEEERGER
jgi:hypothetical protein